MYGLWQRVVGGACGRAAVVLVLLGGAAGALAATVTVQVRIRSEKEDEKVITRAHLLQIREFILKQGRTETFSAMYRNNPAHHTKSFAFFLLPDSGEEGDPAKADFHRVMIQFDTTGPSEYREIDFRDETVLVITASRPADDLTVKQIRGSVENALQEILAEIEPKPAATTPAGR